MSKWYKASELERLRTLAPRDGINGLPDNHVITVSERTIRIDERELVQNNVSTDTYTLELDAEWDDITPVVIFSNSEGDYKVAYENAPTKIPAAVMAVIGAVDVSVFGLDSTGAVRVVTKAAPNTMNVVESGKFVGEISEDDVSLLGQILQAVSDAKAAAQTANTAAENAGTTVDQLKESVETFLSKSQTSVDNAVSSAGNATSAANTATQKANAAADNADKSADAADTAAGSAKAAASRAENAYTVLKPVLSDISVSGNQLRGDLTGTILKAEDAWPAKPMGIKVYGKTRQNLWVNPSGTANGVTVTDNDDGSFTIGGTLVGSGAGLRAPGNIYTLKPNTQYTLSIDKPIASSYTTGSLGACVYVNTLKSDGSYLTDYAIGYGSKLSISFTTGSEFSTCSARINVFSNDFNPGTYRVMLNEGSTAQPWCPPGLNGVDELSIVTAGKNLLPEDARKWDTSSPNASVSIDGDIVTISSTFGAYAYAGVCMDFLAGMTVHFGRKSASGGFHVMQLVYSVDGTIQYVSSERSPHIIPSYATNISIRFYCNNSDDDLAVSTVFAMPYLRVDGIAEYVPLSGFTTTPIDLKGNTLCSLPDGTRDELTIDATGAVTLVKRTNKVKVVADDLILRRTNERYSDFELIDEPRYSGGTSFAVVTKDQMNSLSRVRNADQSVQDGERGIGIYDLESLSGSTFRIGVPSEDVNSQFANCKSWLGSTGAVAIYAIKEHQTIPLDSITLPLLPSPNITVYADAPVTPDMELEYVRDVNKAIRKLEAQIADLVTKEAANV